MESLLSEIRKLKELESKGTPHTDSNDTNVASKSMISSMMNTENKKPVVESEGKVGQPEDVPSLDDIEKMLGMLMYLENLKNTDKAQYVSALKSMGLIGDDFDLNDEKNDPLKSMTESIMKLRDPVAQATANINLPGGGAFMGDAGLEQKKKGKMITPEPGFVIKCKRLDDDEKKVFINVCVHADIDPPGMKKRLNDEGEEVEGMNVPMSMGPAKIEFDKSNNECIVYDMIVNPMVVADAAADKTGKFRDFVCQLGIQCIEQKYKEQVDRRYKLPKLTYLGKEATPQYVQDRKNMPKIEEVEGKSATKKASSKEAQPKITVMEVSDKELDHSLHWRGTDDSFVHLRLQSGEYMEPMTIPDARFQSISLRAETSSRPEPTGIDLKVSQYRVQLKINGYKQVGYYLPCSIDVSQCRCVIDDNGVDIDLPISREPFEAAADPGSKPWLVAQALSENDDSRQTSRNDSDKRQENDNRSNADKFHIKAPDGTGKQSGQTMDIEDVELPEDRFHKLDASSQYLIQQREQGAIDKRAKYEKEREERVNDPNVEYVDMNKEHPAVDRTSANNNSNQPQSEVLNKASQVLEAKLTEGNTKKYSSKLWTQLLD